MEEMRQFSLSAGPGGLEWEVVEAEKAVISVCIQRCGCSQSTKLRAVAGCLPKTLSAAPFYGGWPVTH